VAEPAAGLADDIARAQETLARALGRARIGEDRALANRVRELGERLAHLLAGLLRMTRMHSPDNSAFNKPIADLHTALVELQELLGSVHLVAVEDQVYVNDIRIRSGDKASSIQELGAELQRHNAGGLTFHLPLEADAIRSLIGCLSEAPAASEPRNSLARALHAGGVRGLELQGRYRFRMASEETRETSDPRDFVTRALTATDEAFQNLAAGRVPNPLPLRRIVTELLERGFAAEELWLERPSAPPYAFHQLRVAQLALLVGRALALPPSVLQDLGTAALYHDCGYAAGGAGSTGVAVGFERHALAGARLMLRQKGFHEAKLRRLVSILQHHRDASDPLGVSLFGRVLRVAEDFDTLSRRAGSLPPTHALAVMLKWAGTRYDPVILQLLVNALGAYPPGTLLRLPDGRVARSALPAANAEAFAHPVARCLRLADGSAAPADLPLLDLRGVAPLHVLRTTG
jgi:HD-GYP domain-containing protein (c-di-GMP phosphodiesterase class II)